MYILIFFVVCRFITMHGSRNFRQGGSRFSRQNKPLTTFFFFIIFYLNLVLNLFSVILSFFFKENYNF